MSDKIALVVDTNFIIQNKKLDMIMSELQEKYVAYVTQVSIEERIAQQCRDAKRKIDNISNIQKEYSGLATIKPTTTCDKMVAKIRTGVQANYNKTFGANIISLQKDEQTYSEVLNRAFMKIPPFLSDERIDGKPGGKPPSDKGFKDTLIWISLLNFFKNNGEQNVIFLTDDNGFLNQADMLCAEFNEVTSKDIEIKNNAYFHKLTNNDDTSQETPSTPKEPLPDVRQLRERINTVVNAVCGFETEGYWENLEWVRYFTINEMVDVSYVTVVLSGLDDIITENLFNTEISAHNVFALDDRVIDGYSPIPITALEEFSKLHNEIIKNYPKYVQQFYLTVATIINENYVAPLNSLDNDDDLPF